MCILNAPNIKTKVVYEEMDMLISSTKFLAHIKTFSFYLKYLCFDFSVISQYD